MPTPLLKRIYQLPSLTTPATQLAGAYLVLDVPLGPVPGGYKTFRGTPEELLAYLRAQGLLGSETAALLTADAATGILTYEALKNLAPAEFQALGYAITTAAGTAHYLFNGTTLGAPAATYDSATGELLVTLPAGTDPADVLSVHLYRPVGGQEQMLAADLRPFGGDGPALLTVDLLDLSPALMNAVMALTYTDCDADPVDSPAGSFPGQQFDAIDSQGRNCHFYCTRSTYDPNATPGTTGAGPAWHYTLKLG